MIINSNLYVITGGPGVGKTSLITALREQGFLCVDEVARELIRKQVEIGGDGLPWKNRTRYATLMLEGSVKSYLEHAASESLLFFDRGIPDTLAYARLIGLPDTRFIEQSVAEYRYNPIVFMLPPWEEIYHTDRERKQSFREAMDTYYTMLMTYDTAGYTVAEVPKMPVPERVMFVTTLLTQPQVS